MKTLVVLPSYNESENIVSLIKKILSLSLSYDVLIVEDASKDKTSDVIKKKYKTNKRVIVIDRKKKREEEVVQFGMVSFMG